MEKEYLTAEMLDAMGISLPVLDEVIAIVGRMPTTDEISTLLAMWTSNGKQQSLLQWLKGQPHDAAPRHDYLYNANDEEHTAIREPRIRECYEIAKKLGTQNTTTNKDNKHHIAHGQLIYMIGNVPTQFLDSIYARKYLHIVDNAIATTNNDEAEEYATMILDALVQHGAIKHYTHVGGGGLFGSLTKMCGSNGCGFDILTCREVRLDAFLFGEEKARYVTTIEEKEEDTLLQKLREARINCCFLGRVTKRRIVIDGYDFENVDDYIAINQ